MNDTTSETRVAAAIITRNEERNINDCLRSLQWADEIVIVDSFSSDRTVEISRRYTDKVSQHYFENYSKQRNYALDAVSCPWVMFVDADERVTPDLATEIRAAVANAVSSPRGDAGFWVPRTNLIWGKQIKHTGWNPDYQLRLLRVARARFNDQRAVHEVADVQGTTGYLRQPLIHFNYDTVEQFISKQEAYSTHEARMLRSEGVRPRPINYIGAPAREFYRRYITLQGYRDGLHGLTLSALLAWYKREAYAKMPTLVEPDHLK